MESIMRVFIIGFVFIAGIHTAFAHPVYQKGMSYTPWSKDALSTANSDRSIANMREIGVEWVALTVFLVSGRPNEFLDRRRLQSILRLAGIRRTRHSSNPSKRNEGDAQAARRYAHRRTGEEPSFPARSGSTPMKRTSSIGRNSPKRTI